MNELIPMEKEGMRVLTTQQLADAYETDDKKIRDNFTNNKSRYIEGKHFFKVEGEELRALKNDTENFGAVGSNASCVYLWTERGALLQAKSLNTDKAWQVYDILVETYFAVKEQKQLSPMEQLKLQYQVIEQHEEKLNTIETKVNHLENNMVIEHGQEVTLKKEVDIRVKRVCYGNESPAYLDKTLRAKVYRALWRDYKGYFNIVSYHDTLKKDLDNALTLIRTWAPSGGLLREIQTSNNQMVI